MTLCWRSPRQLAIRLSRNQRCTRLARAPLIQPLPTAWGEGASGCHLPAARATCSPAASRPRPASTCRMRRCTMPSRWRRRGAVRDAPILAWLRQLSHEALAAGLGSALATSRLALARSAEHGASDDAKRACTRPGRSATLLPQSRVRPASHCASSPTSLLSLSMSSSAIATTLFTVSARSFSSGRSGPVFCSPAL